MKDAAESPEVRRKESFIRDLHLEGLFEESDQVSKTAGIQGALCEERKVDGQRIRYPLGGKLLNESGDLSGDGRP